jgi:hypothetical protein
MITDRWRLALVGAAGGALLWAVLEALDRGLIGDRTAEVLGALVSTLVVGILAMAGPIGQGPALRRALPLAGATAALVWLGGLRFDEGLDGSALSVLAALVVATLPLPFLIAQTRGVWRDYAALFLEAWSIVVRYAAAWAFAGLVWLVIFLSDQVLQIVGITWIADLMELRLVGLVVTGASLGLGMAVVHELAELLSPYLILRLFRLLLPVLLGVMVVFLAALPFRGLEGLFSDLSPTLVLLALVAAGVSLVAIAVDQSDAEAAESPLLVRATQGMALTLPLFAAIAAWGLWLRVEQHGWTPERLFVALVAGIGLAYGLTYAVAVLRGPGWRGRIRAGNIRVALGVIGLAALWLTPLMNAEAIAARSQLARYDAGQTALAELDLVALGRWGRPGAAVLAELAARAEAPGQEALAARLAGTDGADEGPDAAALAAVIPVQPTGAGAMRDILFAAAAPHERRDWAARCLPAAEGGQPGCVLVVADLLPDRPGEEAMLVLGAGTGYQDVMGLYLDDAGRLAVRAVYRADGGYASAEDARALLDAARLAPPPLTAARINQLGTGPEGLLFLP